MRHRRPSRNDRPGAAAPPAAGAALLALALAACGRPEAPPPIADANAPGTAPNVSLEAPDEHFTRPMAIVNGVTIYQVTYDEILEALRSQIPPGDPDSVERYIGAKTLALEKAIDEELLFQQAARQGYDPKPDEISRIYADRVQQYGSEARFLAATRNKRLSKGELLYSYRRAISIDRFMKAEIESNLAATDDEVRAFYEMRPELFTPDKWLKVGQIFVNAPLDWPMNRRTEALTRLTRAVESLRRGRTFESLARDISEDEAGPQGGMIGFVKRGGLAEQLDRAIFAMKPGEISGIIESEKGYHLLKVYEVRGGQLEPFDKVKDQARQKLITKKRGDALSTLLNSLREPAKIERLQT